MKRYHVLHPNGHEDKFVSLLNVAKFINISEGEFDAIATMDKGDTYYLTWYTITRKN